MKKILLIQLLLLCLNSYSQVYYEAIGEAAKQENSYDVTVTDLYGNYNQYKVQIENLNPSTRVFSGNNTNGTDSYGNVDFGQIALDAARMAREQKRRNANNEYLNKIRYLEFELRNALLIINNQARLMKDINMLNDITEKVLIEEIADLKKQLKISSFEIRKSNIYSTEYKPENNEKVNMAKAKYDFYLLDENFKKTKYLVKKGKSVRVEFCSESSGDCRITMFKTFDGLREKEGYTTSDRLIFY